MNLRMIPARTFSLQPICVKKKKNTEFNILVLSLFSASLVEFLIAPLPEKCRQSYVNTAGQYP